LTEKLFKGGKLKRFIAIWILLSAGLNIWQSIHIKKLEEKRPIIVYKADNQGAEIKGKVVHKEKIGELYTITIQNYGIFVVTQTSYESLRIGDEVRL
jgi:gp27